MWFEELQFKQLCHRKVKIAVQAWAKKTGRVEKVKTWGVSGKSIISKVLKAKDKGVNFRYDLETNDQDGSFYEFCSMKGGGSSWQPGLPAVMFFEFKVGNDEEKKEVIIFHIFSEDLAFVSAAKEEWVSSFVGSLGD